MGCKNNCYNVSYHPCSSNYAFAGDCNMSTEYLLNDDAPKYTGRFYSQSPQEIFSDFQYNRIGFDNYDSNNQVEAHIPRSSMVVDDSGSALPSPREIIPFSSISESIPQSVKSEIERAQQEVSGKEIIFQERLVEEMIIRRFRERTIVIKDRKEVKDKRNIIDQ